MRSNRCRGLLGKAVAVFAVLVTALVLGLGMAPTAALAEGEASLGAPEHEKTITDNRDGTYTLTLDVTGATDSSSETVNKPVDIVLVVDQSSSMNDNDRMKNVRNAAMQLANSVLADNEDGQVRISVVLFGTYTQDKDGNTKVGGSGWLTSANQVANVIPSKAPNDQTGIFENGNGTNWEAGLREANNIISGSDRPDAEKYVIFLSDGEPTYRLEDAGNDTGMIESWTDRFFDRTTGERVYWISGIFSDPHFSTSPIDIGGRDVDTANVEHVAGTGNTNPDGENSQAALGVAQQISKNATFFSVSAESGTDALMRSFHQQVTGSEDGFYSAGDADSLNKAFEDITSTILREASYRNVVITDTLSEYVSGVTPKGDFTDDGHVDPRTFVYKQDRETWEDAPKASVDPETGAITWNLGDRTLEDGVTYSVSFKAAPNQDAFDEAAAMGKETDFLTNGAANVSYEVFKTVNGKPTGEAEEGSVPYDPQHVTVPVSTLTITKIWNGDGAKPDSVTVQVQQDGAKYGDAVTLSAENDWTANVVVPAGPLGHTYTVVETSGNGAWTPSYAYSVADSTTSSDQGVTLTGTAAQSATATVTNTPTVTPLTLQDILHVTKTMHGHALEKDMFDFTVTAVGTDDVTAEEAAAFAGFANGTTTLTVQNGAAAMGEPDTVHTGNQLTFDYDDLGVTYAYEYRESSTFHDGYTLDGVTFDNTQYRAELTAQKVGDSNDIQVLVNVYTREGDTGNWGDPTETYTVAENDMPEIKIAFENTYTPLGLTVKKVNQDGGALTGAKFTLRVDDDDDTYNETNDTVAKDVHNNAGMTGDALTEAGIEVGDDSTVSFYGLEAGETYWIVETYAPTGYQIPAPYRLEVSHDGTMATFFGSDGMQIGEPKNFEDRMVSINFMDRGLDPIPETGGIGNVPLYVGGILAVAGSVVISRRGRANG